MPRYGSTTTTTPTELDGGHKSPKATERSLEDTNGVSPEETYDETPGENYKDTIGYNHKADPTSDDTPPDDAHGRPTPREALIRSHSHPAPALSRPARIRLLSGGSLYRERSIDVSSYGQAAPLEEVEEEPPPPPARGLYSRIFPTPFLHEFKETNRIAWPLVLVFISQAGMQPVATMFGGHLGKLELDGVALSNSVINVMGNSVVIGLASASDTLFAQTYGSVNRKNLGVQFQRSLLLLLLASIPCYAIQLNAETLLKLIGQDPVVAEICGRYILIFTPGFVATYLFTVLNKYLQCQNITLPSMVIGGVGFVYHIIAQYLLLYVAEWGIEGSAIAQASAYVLMTSALGAYIMISGVYKDTWEGWDRRILLQWGLYMKLALFGMLMMCMEWWAFEINVFLAGTVGTTELGAQASVLQIDILFYAIAGGMSTATAIRIGQYVGAGRPRHAITAMRVGIAILVVTSLLITVVLLATRHVIGRLFTQDVEVIELMSTIIIFCAIYIFFDNIATIGRATVRGCGRQEVGTVLVFVAYYIVAEPIGICLMYLTPLNIIGLWIGLDFGLVALAIAMMVYTNCVLDWDLEVQRAQVRVGVKASSPAENTTDEKTPLLGIPDSPPHPLLPADSDPEAVTPCLLVTRILTILAFIALLAVSILCRIYIHIDSPGVANSTLPTPFPYNFTTFSRTFIEK